ncbi:Asp-tRNA(Asn)/Glu-tRNA(Gln) amidotransferase subunit GatC [Chloroflexota bacterium]
MLTQQEVLHIATLARLGVDESEIEKFREQLNNILENFDVLKQVDTEGVPPTSQSVPLQNVFRDDKVADSLPKDDVLANAPRREGDLFRVKAVLE